MIELLLHADEQLALWATEYGFIVYGILFLIIFAETGLVVTPFLPGRLLLSPRARSPPLGRSGWTCCSR